MNKNFRDENTDMLMRAVMSADSIEECYAFFEDLCSEGEIRMMSQRLQVAKMLREKAMYSDIVRKTKAGTATIGNVKANLSNGTGGYGRAIDRAEMNGGDAV